MGKPGGEWPGSGKPEPAPPGTPLAAELRAVPVGAEMAIADHLRASFLPPPGRRLFWLNLAQLAVLAPLATFWFQRHLEPYFTEILVVGGSLTLWALIRLVWAVVEKLSRFDPWERSRSLLATPALTRLLLVGWIVQGTLWFSTASLYLELSGAAAGAEDYAVQVVRKPTAQRFLPDVKVSPAHRLEGGPHFWGQANAALECRIVSHAGFDPIDCSLRPGASTRVKVPQAFPPKELHLLRLVPYGTTYSQLALPGEAPPARYRLTLKAGGSTYQLEDLRRQTVHLGAQGEDMKLVSAADRPEDFRQQLIRDLTALGQDQTSAGATATVLVREPRPWDVLRVRQGDRLTLSVEWSRTDNNGQVESGVLPGYPVVHDVTAEKVQTVWLPKP